MLQVICRNIVHQDQVDAPFLDFLLCDEVLCDIFLFERLSFSDFFFGALVESHEYSSSLVFKYLNYSLAMVILVVYGFLGLFCVSGFWFFSSSFFVMELIVPMFLFKFL